MKTIKQDVTMLRAAYEQRLEEYRALRAAKQWAGSIYLAGIVVEIALKLVIGRHLGVAELPDIFKSHDLELLRYCSGLEPEFDGRPRLSENFTALNTTWRIDLRYQGAKSETESDAIDKALHEPNEGLLSFLSVRF